MSWSEIQAYKDKTKRYNSVHGWYYFLKRLNLVCWSSWWTTLDMEINNL